jgi:hypothetical protein
MRAKTTRKPGVLVGAKHSGEESISQNREFIIRMLRPLNGDLQQRDAPWNFGPFDKLIEKKPVYA